MPWIDKHALNDHRRTERELDAAKKFIADLGLVFPQIVDAGYYDTTMYFGGPTNYLGGYRVADVHRAAGAKKGQSDIELLADLRDPKPEPEPVEKPKKKKAARTGCAICDSGTERRSSAGDS